jgi:lysophospholipase L1-like esterase
MKRLFNAVLFFCLTMAATAAEPHPYPEIKAFEAAEKNNPPPRHAVVFLGSSSIRKWTSLKRDFPGHTVINRGFGGSQIIDSVDYFERIVVPLQPKLIVFYAGSNDINARKKPETVFKDFQELVRKMEMELPDTKLAFISIVTSPSRWRQVEEVKKANGLIAEFISHDPKLSFLNVFPLMLDSEGKPKPELYVADRLHMTAKGYAQWTSVIGPYLDKVD